MVIWKNMERPGVRRAWSAMVFSIVPGAPWCFLQECSLLAGVCKLLKGGGEDFECLVGARVLALVWMHRARCLVVRRACLGRCDGLQRQPQRMERVALGRKDPREHVGAEGVGE